MCFDVSEVRHSFLLKVTELCSRSYRRDKEKEIRRIYRNPTRIMVT
jgi:hypothetical protein